MSTLNLSCSIWHIYIQILKVIKGSCKRSHTFGHAHFQQLPIFSFFVIVGNLNGTQIMPQRFFMFFFFVKRPVLKLSSIKGVVHTKKMKVIRSSCRFKPVRTLFMFRTQIQIFIGEIRVGMLWSGFLQPIESADFLSLWSTDTDSSFI